MVCKSSWMLLAVLLVAGSVLLQYTAAMSMQSYTEQGECQGEQICQYSYEVRQKLFQDTEETFAVKVSVEVTCNSVGVFNGSTATQYCMTLTDTKLDGSMFANSSEQQIQGQQRMTNALLSGWFCFVQTESGKVVAVYHASGENPEALNFKKTIAAAFQANFEGTEEQEELDPQSSHKSHYQYSATSDDGMIIMHRKVEKDDVIEYSSGVASEDVQLVKDEDIEYHSGTLYHSGGDTSIKIIRLSKEKKNWQESVFNPATFSASGSYSLDLQRCYSLSQTVHSRKRRSLEEEIERDFEEDSLKATINEEKVAADQMEQLREQIPSVTATLQLIHEDPKQQTLVDTLARLLVLEAQYGPLPQHTPALSEVILFREMGSQDSQDVDMRIVIYSLLSSEGSLQSQMILLNGLTHAPTEDEKSAIAIQIAFIKNPREELVCGIEDLLHDEQNEGLLLAYGALASEASPAIQSRIVTFLLTQHTTAISKNDTNKLVYIIYALGNTGVQQALPTITSYLDYPVLDIKLVAVSSLRKFTQSQMVQDAFEQILVRGPTERLVGAITEVLVGGLEYSQQQHAHNPAIEPSDELISALVSAALLFNDIDLHELVSSYLSRLTSERAETERQRLQYSRSSGPREKRGTVWNDCNTVYDLVSSCSSRNADVSNYCYNTAYIWGNEFGTSDINVKLAGGVFMGVSCDCNNMKAFARVAAKGELFGNTATLAEIELLLEKDDINIRGRLFTRIAGNTLLNVNREVAAQYCFTESRSVNSASLEVFSVSYSVFIYVGYLTFSAYMRAEANMNFNAQLCGSASVYDLLSASASVDPTIRVTVGGGATATLLEVARGGVALDAVISYTLEPACSARLCGAHCAASYQTCAGIYHSSPNNYVDLYTWYQVREVQWCDGGWFPDYPCGFDYGDRNRWDDFSTRWDLAGFSPTPIYELCEGSDSGICSA